MIRREPFFRDCGQLIPAGDPASCKISCLPPEEKQAEGKYMEKVTMDILNSGSFVPLDNREKIEQLIFTARTLATETSRMEGFQSSGQTNQQLALEMWKGAEYMCRSHEEATVRNLFLSKFLEKLREIEKQSAVQSRMPQVPIVDPPPTPQPVPVVEPLQVSPPPTVIVRSPQETSQDEYLGVVSEEEGIEIERSSYADECVPEAEAEIVAMGNGPGAEDFISTRLEDSRADDPILVVGNSQETKASAVPREAVEKNIESESQEPDKSESIESIVLLDKEPYNFNSCTVTAVIQLLPENNGVRKCVVSVRSHDFAPQISIFELSTAAINEDAKRSLEEALGRYRTELPVLAAEKIKKEKPANKKRSAKPNDKSKPTAAGSSVDTSSTSAVTPPPDPNPEAVKDQQTLFAS